MAATVLTRVELDAARTPFTAAQTVRIDNILVCNATGSAIEVVFTNAATTEILSIAVPANDSFEYSVSWICDAGMIIATEGDAAVSVTIAHSQHGA
jgi:hypothetical protein